MVEMVRIFRHEFSFDYLSFVNVLFGFLKDRSLTFPSVTYIRYVISKASKVWGQNQLPVVINCLHIQFADYTAAVGIKEVIDLFKKRDQKIILWQVKPSIVRVLSAVLNDPGTHEDFHFCRSEEEVENIIGKSKFS